MTFQLAKKSVPPKKSKHSFLNLIHEPISLSHLTHLLTGVLSLVAGEVDFIVEPPAEMRKDGCHIAILNSQTKFNLIFVWFLKLVTTQAST